MVYKTKMTIRTMNLKPLHAIFVFALLAVSSIWAGYSSYNRTREAIVCDMNQALARTLAGKNDCWITPDTIQDYRNNLKLQALKECSFVYYAMDDDNRSLCSRRMKWHRSDEPLEFQGYANCSAASVFAMSDQRMSGMLSVVSLLWAVGMVLYFRNHREGMTVLGDLMMSNNDCCFYDRKHRPVRMTPMQEQLMRMFFTSENNQLSKQEICDALWPKKPDASDTLYTLIRRLKPIVEEKGNLEIVSGRGKDYQLRALS